MKGLDYNPVNASNGIWIQLNDMENFTITRKNVSRHK